MKKSLSNYFINFFKNKKTILVSGAVIVILILVIIFSRDSGMIVEVSTSKIGNVTEKISVTGKISPVKKAELGFEKGGIVSSINYRVGESVNIGDTIISLDPDDASAQLKGAQANLIAEKAKFTELMKGLRPEELSVEGAKLRNSQTSYENAKIGVINALHDSYIKTENAIFNYSDSFFTNPQSVVPRINIRTQNYSEQNTVENGRLIVGENLRYWKNDLNNISTFTDPDIYLEKAHNYLTNTKSFISLLSTIVSNLTPGNSGNSQSLIDSYNAIVNSSLSIFNSAVESLAVAESAYKNASSTLLLTKDQFGLAKAGSTEQAIQMQQARVDQASANVLASQIDLSKKKIISPIVGIVTKINPEIGEFVSMGQILVTVMSNVFKAEVNIPEADIAKVSIGNSAFITLDAYGDSVLFNAHISAIDPAETIIEGVPTYKVTLQFDQYDERIRSGMTANIDIIANNKTNVVTVPYRSIINKNGVKYVRVVDDSSKDGFVETKVEVGIRGSDGLVEILSGLNPDTKIVISVK